MSYYSATWALLLALPLLARAQSTASLPPSGPWGNGPSNGIHWSLDAGQSGAYITYASTTLEVPGVSGQLFIQSFESSVHEVSQFRV